MTDIVTGQACVSDLPPNITEEDKPKHTVPAQHTHQIAHPIAHTRHPTGKLARMIPHTATAPTTPPTIAQHAHLVQADTGTHTPYHCADTQHNVDGVEGSVTPTPTYDEFAEELISTDLEALYDTEGVFLSSQHPQTTQPPIQHIQK